MPGSGCIGDTMGHGLGFNYGCLLSLFIFCCCGEGRNRDEQVLGRRSREWRRRKSGILVHSLVLGLILGLGLRFDGLNGQMIMLLALFIHSRLFIQRVSVIQPNQSHNSHTSPTF